MEVQNSISNLHERENLKMKYKKQRLQQVQDIYLCQCQKVYLSFPALYLHVRNKHKIKLTTKITDKICKMEEKDGKNYITYFLRNEQQNEEKSSIQIKSDDGKKSTENERMKSKHTESDERADCNLHSDQTLKNDYRRKIDQKCIQELYEVVNNFLTEQSYLGLYTNGASNRILAKFVEYIEKCNQISKQFYDNKKYPEGHLISTLPLYFNEFLCFYLPMNSDFGRVNPNAMRMEIEIIKLFGNWLASRNYTCLQVFESI